MKAASWLDPLEDRIGHWAIPNITKGIIILNAVVFLGEIFSPGFSHLLKLDAVGLHSGELWRIFTFLFVPPPQSILFFLILLWFLYYVGNQLEQTWGAFKLNCFYLIGMISLTIACLLTGNYQVDNTYLNSTFILALAATYPEEEIFLFPIPIPMKIKYIGWFSLGLTLISFVMNPELRFIILASLVNVAVFFLPDWIKEKSKSRR